MSRPTLVPPARDDLADMVVAAQLELAEGVKRADLMRDPYRFLIGGISTALGVFPGLVARMEQAAENARTPFSPEQQAALRRDVRDGLRQEAAKLTRAFSLRTATTVGAAIAVAALVGAGGGYWLGRASIREDVATLEGRLALNPGASRAWVELMRANPDPRPALAAASTWSDPSGRKAAELRVWLEPPASAPPRR